LPDLRKSEVGQGALRDRFVTEAQGLSGGGAGPSWPEIRSGLHALVGARVGMKRRELLQCL